MMWRAGRLGCPREPNIFDSYTGVQFLRRTLPPHASRLIATLASQSAPGPRASSATPQLVVVTRFVQGMAPWPFLRAAEGEPRGFWARDERWVAHRGVALAVEGAGHGRFHDVREAIAAQVPAAPEGIRVRLYGGFAFRDDHAPQEHWSGFPAALLHLPRFELTGDASGQGRLRAQALAEGPAETDAVRAELEAELDPLIAQLGAGGSDASSRSAPSSGIEPSSVTGHITASRDDAREAWGRAIDAVLDAVKGGALSKAVLARTADVALDGRISPNALAEALWRRNAGTHVFFFEPTAGQALVGAAPEALATVRGGVFHATAVAGSVARGTDAEADRWLARQLLDSRKDRAEHQLVVDDMATRLEAFAHDIRTDAEPSVLRLARIQHLETGVRARLVEGTHVLELVEALHPTPAVCGVPRDAALELLRNHEPFDRGWYAGPVGWLSTDGEGHFVPALRTAVGTGQHWRLYAGAGIVDGSSAQGEWDETAIKFQPVLRALGSCGATLSEEDGEA